jgi:hypothetical protein
MAPVFCKKCSCFLTKDSMNLLVARLLFDIAETTTRSIRRELQQYQDQMNIDNVYSMFFTTVRNKWEGEMQSYFGSIVKQVLIEKNDSIYYAWRADVDTVLLESTEFATEPIDCHRIIINKPIEENYKAAESIMGDMRKNKEE